VCGILLGALSVGPPDEGVGVTLQGGGGSYQYKYQGCEHVDPNRYGVNTVEAYAAVRLRDEHLTATVEGMVEPGKVVRADCGGCGAPAPDLGRSVQAYMGAARLGGAWAYGGFELGLAGGSFAPGENQTPFPSAVLPSVSLWTGNPEAAFVWTTLAAGSGPPGIFAGIGHHDAAFGISAGIGGDGLHDQGPIFTLTADWKVHPVFEPGVELRYHDGQNWTAALRFTIDLSRAARHQP
jgi:hypothetical protein